MEQPTSRDYYMFADQDDIWHPDKLSRTLRRMKRMEWRYGADTPALVFTDAAVVDEHGGIVSESFCGMQHYQVRNRSLAHLLMENVCQGCTVMMNEALAERVRVPAQGVRYHDWWVALAAAAFGHIGFLPSSTMDYRLHGGNTVGADGFFSYVKHRLSGLMGQRRALMATWRQGREFLSCYEQELAECGKRELVGEFCRMPERMPFGRVWSLVRYRFCKSGLIRNLGLFFSMFLF